jgi:enediyne biosynthesis protein E4
MHLVAFGTAFVDVDNDSWEDLVFVAGHVVRRPALGSTFKQRPVLLRNTERNGRRIFTDISPQGGAFFSTPVLGRGLAIGDLDNDGWPDQVVSNINSPAVLLRNVAGKAASPANHWLGICLVGRDHRDVVGSTVVLEGETRKLTRFAKGGGSYLSASDQRILFGLGESKEIRSVTVRWSWGETQTWSGLDANAYWELREGEEKAVPVKQDTP